MPTYDYHCLACEHAFELMHSMSEAPRRKCPKCGKNRLERRIGTGAGIVFKGSGFYLTDYRSKSYQEGAKADVEPKPASTEPAQSAAAATKGDSKSKSEAGAVKDGSNASAKDSAKSESKPAPKSESSRGASSDARTKKPKG